MATTSLGLHYYIKDGHRDTVLSKLKGVIDLCTVSVWCSQVDGVGSVWHGIWTET
jgi:hypothetical protein